jgi:hypothetical protein
MAGSRGSNPAGTTGRAFPAKSIALLVNSLGIFKNQGSIQRAKHSVVV